MDIFLTGDRAVVAAISDNGLEEVKEFDEPQTLSTNAQPLNCPSGIAADPWTIGAVVLLSLKLAPDVLKFATSLVNFLRGIKNDSKRDKNVVINLKLDSGAVLTVSDLSDPEKLAADLQQ